jgi:hypothetical protein
MRLGGAGHGMAVLGTARQGRVSSVVLNVAAEGLRIRLSRARPGMARQGEAGPGSAGQGLGFLLFTQE